MKYRSVYIQLLFILALLSSCKEEKQYVYPSVKLEFLTAQADDVGGLLYLIKDDGSKLRVVADHTGTLFTVDSETRIVCNYVTLEEPTVTEEGTAEVYSLLSPVSLQPIKLASPSTDMKVDPLAVQSIWLSGKYINMVLLVKAQDGKHFFHFIEDSIAAESGRNRVYLTLYHDKGDDVEAYSKNAYASVPLASYIAQYKNGFYISFRIHTYGKLETYKFEYKPAD